MNKRIRTIFHLIPALILLSLTVSTLAQEVSIPDPGLNAAVREALQKPDGPLAATNLAALVASLQSQGVSVITFPVTPEVFIPDPGLNAAVREALEKPDGPLTEQDLLDLTILNARSRDISNLQGLEAAHNLTALDLEANQLTSVSFPNGLTSLNSLDLSSNPLFRLALSADMTNLTDLELLSDQLTILIVPAELRNLITVDLEDNNLSSSTCLRPWPTWTFSTSPLIASPTSPCRRD